MSCKKNITYKIHSVISRLSTPTTPSVSIDVRRGPHCAMQEEEPVAPPSPAPTPLAPDGRTSGPASARDVIMAGVRWAAVIEQQQERTITFGAQRGGGLRRPPEGHTLRRALLRLPLISDEGFLVRHVYGAHFTRKGAP
ncbi:hypothetical protein AAFF_G00183650 [Aldrovandia affinis]|uniref:Uncharacterized protein n=1 Tax=Aldrovandia affinis TaxID=143900 RepID=A0AAD7RK75_9TELE|nr:hypothetical protein AAFF_G00183650 [Aldrovandia affinis]